MEEKREEIENVVRKCVGKLNMQVNEEQIQSTVNRLIGMKDMKSVMDSLSMTIDQLFGKPEQKTEFEQCMEDILTLDNSTYKTTDEMIAQVKANKEANYIPRGYFSRGKSYFNK